MNNVKSAPDIGPKPVSKHAVVQNAMDMVCVARPIGNLRLSLFNERRRKEEEGSEFVGFYFCGEMKETNHRQNHTYV